MPFKNNRNNQMNNQLHPRPVLANNQFKVSNLMTNDNTSGSMLMGADGALFNTIDESRLSKKRIEEVEASIAGSIVKSI
jgi:hypothetical protein